MIDTKLILVDGIPGAGKSTTAQFIARQLEKNGIKTKIYNETDNNHPLGRFDIY
jgi:thymidylate kinase